MANPFKWDHFSDQPALLKDKKYKQRMRKKHSLDIFILFITNLFIFPLAFFLTPFFRGNSNNKKLYGMGVNLDKGKEQFDLIKELNVKNLLIRIPLSDIKNLDQYIYFVKQFGDDKDILINILQDREHIENKTLLEQSIHAIFSSNIAHKFQIANAINRSKWGFFSVKEYLYFYKTIQNIRDKYYPTIKLIGPSVIDFEYHFTIRALFNFFTIKFDSLSALLYVDRRGSPHNTQMGIFNTKNKINFLYSIAKLSPKTTSKIIITEVNWPLSNTAPYAPTSELECVSEDDYSIFMLDYYNIAKQSKKIQTIYWHQLIASGYGLVDNRDGKIRKTKAFYSYKEMVKNG